MKDNNAIHQLGLKTKIPSDMGIDKPNAVKADNCCGDKFFEAGMIKQLSATSL